jgi:hypothetical protein
VELHEARGRTERVHRIGALVWRGSADPDRRSCGNAVCPGGSRAGQLESVDGVLQLDTPEAVHV